jgi:hypothetical protein
MIPLFRQYCSHPRFLHSHFLSFQFVWTRPSCTLTFGFCIVDETPTCIIRYNLYDPRENCVFHLGNLSLQSKRNPEVNAFPLAKGMLTLVHRYLFCGDRRVASLLGSACLATKYQKEIPVDRVFEKRSLWPGPELRGCLWRLVETE